jgi:hypothetical protein
MIDVLACTPSLVSDKVALEESSGRSSGPQIRFVAPTIRSASLPMGWTHLSGVAASLVDGDPGLPMYHSGP